MPSALAICHAAQFDTPDLTHMAMPHECVEARAALLPLAGLIEAMQLIQIDVIEFARRFKLAFTPSMDVIPRPPRELIPFVPVSPWILVATPRFRAVL